MLFVIVSREENDGVQKKLRKREKVNRGRMEDGCAINPFQADHDRGFVLWQSFWTRAIGRGPLGDLVDL